MKQLSRRSAARFVAAAGVPALAFLAVVSPAVSAKRAPLAPTKRVTESAETRLIDRKQDQPGPAFERQWEMFRTAAANKRPASTDPMFGDTDMFARFSAITGAPRVVYGDLGEAPAAAKAGERAMQWLQANAHTFGVDTADLELASSVDTPGQPAHYYYNQKYQGLPVFRAEVAVHIGVDGHVWGVTNSYVPTHLQSNKATVSSDAAITTALAAANIERSAVIESAPIASELGVYPTADGGRLAYRVTISSRNPAGFFEAFVDATTGESLVEPANLMCTADGQGAVLQPNPVVSEGINNLTDGTVLPDSYYKPVTLQYLDATTGKLIGAYSQVHPSMTSPAVRANLNFSDLRRANNTTNQFDEEEVYWAINEAQNAFQSLGYTTANANPIMNYSIKVWSHGSATWGNQDNSSFSPSNIDGPGTGILEFGTGGVDDASDAEIIWHEFGHATLYNQRPGINQNVTKEGIGEGWGDYLAGTMSEREPGAYTYHVTVGEWDAVSYNPGNPGFLRRLDTATLWANRPNEVHDAGEIWSHPLFDYNEQVGPTLGLHVALEANKLMDLSPTQAEGAAAMVAAEQALTGGATAGQVKNAFYERGTLSGTVHPIVHTPGIGVQATGTFFLRNSSTGGGADITVGFGSPALTQIVGDWNGNGSDTIGGYDPTTGNFFLKNSNQPGGADLAFSFGGGGAGIVPIVGDWDGNGTETVGLYNTTNGTFFLKNTNAPGGADVAFQFGGGGATVVPVVGDWDGNGSDTVGLFNTATGVFFLKNSNGAGGADITFQFGAGGADVTPVAGDWDGSGADSVGIYVGGTATFFLKNANASGSADYAFTYGAPNAKPLTGDWNGGMHPFNPFG